MSDDTKVKSSLRKAQDQVNEGLNALRGNNVKTALDKQPEFEILRKDYISVVSLIHSYSTRLWIALGKQPPTPSAAWPTLDELSKHSSSLYGCILAFSETKSPTFTSEARKGGIEVLLALQDLLQEYSSGADGSDSMRKTAALHEVCDSAKNISLDDREAVLRVWKQDSEVVKDAIKELGALVNPKADSGSEEFDDGWDELLGEDAESSELSEDERITAKKVLVVLEKVSALRKQVQKGTISDKTQVQGRILPYQQILEHSKMMISTVDDVVGCLNPPLELGELRRLLDRLSCSLHSLVRACSGPSSNVVEGLASLEISDGVSKTAPISSTSPLAVKADEIVVAIQAI